MENTQNVYSYYKMLAPSCVTCKCTLTAHSAALLQMSNSVKLVISSHKVSFVPCSAHIQEDRLLGSHLFTKASLYYLTDKLSHQLATYQGVGVITVPKCRNIHQRAAQLIDKNLARALKATMASLNVHTNFCL